MAKLKLFMSRKLFPDIIKKLYDYYDVEIWDRHEEIPYDVLLTKVRDIDAFASLLSDRIDCNLLNEARNLKIIAQYAVGYNNIDLECATRKGIYVTNTPDVLTDATAELTWALLLATARNIVVADHFVRFGEWDRGKVAWHPEMFLGHQLSGKVLGIIGLGRIGKRVAEYGKAFRMKVIYHNRKRDEKAERELGVEYKALDELLSSSDFITIHTPLTQETYHMIGERELKLMKKTAILVNVARGPVVDTPALVRALREGWIAGAGLDVFEEEPLPANHELTSLKNVVMVPHIGSATYDTRRAMAQLVVDNLIAFAKGEIPPTLVNKEVLKAKGG
ncbi:MAG: D-glycerate dehydrogenase [Synergistetes bacterium]|nr:D-glycerate dehydrogenase [Synergistota bacterium]MDW8191688.1 glyoxylate reductase [Synergistota bacterium]